jgi:hypothetical protein
VLRNSLRALVIQTETSLLTRLMANLRGPVVTSLDMGSRVSVFVLGSLGPLILVLRGTRVTFGHSSRLLCARIINLVVAKVLHVGNRVSHLEF